MARYTLLLGLFAGLVAAPAALTPATAPAPDANPLAGATIIWEDSPELVGGATVDTAKSVVFKGQIKGNDITGEITVSVIKAKKTFSGAAKGMIGAEKWNLGFSGTLNPKTGDLMGTGSNKGNTVKFEGYHAGKTVMGLLDGKINGKDAFMVFRGNQQK